MELLEPKKPLEFKWKDVTFLVKPFCSAGDKAEILLAGESKGNGQFEFTRATYVKTVLRRMIVGWKGVTLRGQEAPYSFETLDQLFPKDDGVFAELFNFIHTHTDVGPHKEALKNELREQQSGSPA